MVDVVSRILYLKSASVAITSTEMWASFQAKKQESIRLVAVNVTDFKFNIHL